MLIAPVIFRGTFGVKSAINQAPIFKNLLQKSIFRQCTGFQIWNGNSRMIFSTIRRRMSVSGFSKTIESIETTGKLPIVLNNVIIYKYEKGKSFIFLMVFAVVQLFGMLSMAKNMYDTFLPNFFSSGKNWWTQICENKFSSFAIFSGCFFGPVIFLLIYIIVTRTIRRAILNKGSRKVTIVTYHPIPSMRTQSVPLQDLSCKNSRKSVGTVLLKIKGRRFFYFLDADADFPNAALFDFTVGVRRY